MTGDAFVNIDNRVTPHRQLGGFKDEQGIPNTTIDARDDEFLSAMQCIDGSTHKERNRRWHSETRDLGEGDMYTVGRAGSRQSYDSIVHQMVSVMIRIMTRIIQRGRLAPGSWV